MLRDGLLNKSPHLRVIPGDRVMEHRSQLSYRPHPGIRSRRALLLVSPFFLLDWTGGGRLSTGRVLRDLCRKRGDTDTEEH